MREFILVVVAAALFMAPVIDYGTGAPAEAAIPAGEEPADGTAWVEGAR